MRNIDSILGAIRDVHDKIGTEGMIKIFQKHANSTKEGYNLTEYLNNFENHYSGIFQSGILWEKKVIYTSTKKFGGVNVKSICSKRIVLKNKFVSYSFKTPLSNNNNTKNPFDSSPRLIEAA